MKELGELEVQKDEDLPFMDKLHYLEAINSGLQIGEHTHHEALWFYCPFLLSPSVPSATLIQTQWPQQQKNRVYTASHLNAAVTHNIIFFYPQSLQTWRKCTTNFMISLKYNFLRWSCQTELKSFLKKNFKTNTSSFQRSNQTLNKHETLQISTDSSSCKLSVCFDKQPVSQILQSLKFQMLLNLIHLNAVQGNPEMAWHVSSFNLTIPPSVEHPVCPSIPFPVFERTSATLQSALDLILFNCEDLDLIRF